MSTGYRFRVLNPGASVPIWPDPTSWKLDRYFDKAGQLEIEMAGQHGIADRARVDCFIAEEQGAASYSDIAFRGFVMPSDDKGDDVTKIVIKEQQKILDHRFTQTCRYAAGVTLAEMLSDDWPLPGETPGLICQASHLVQPGSFVLHSGQVWRLPQGGTSFLGSLHALGDNVYIDSTKQTWGSSATLSSGQYFQDSDYLYIRVPDASKNPYNYMILAEGVYETNIRLGSLEKSTETFAKSWRVGNSRVTNEIMWLLQAKELEFQFIHSADGYSYLNAAAAIGRGANATYYPTYRYDQCRIIKGRRNTTGGNLCHALRGAGIGKGASRQFYTEGSFPPGLRFVEQEEYNGQFYDQLSGTVAKRYADIQDTTAWIIETETDPAAMPGDYIKIVPQYEGAVIERIKQITLSSDSPMKICAGQRGIDVEDRLKSKKYAQDMQQRELDLQYATISATGQENLDNTYPCEILLDVPAENVDGELDSTWLMSVKIGPYEASTNTIQHPQTNHGAGGADTTSGSGGAHDDHDLGGITSGVGAGTLVGFNVETGYQIEDGSDHYHDVDAGTTYYVPYALDHSHSYANGTYPDEAAAHDVPLKVNPATDATKSDVIDRATALGGTHSWLAYVTVTIKIINSLYPSGQDVPGSPFADIALNESISDIDVSGMVVTGANTVRISIARYGTPGPGETSVVRARASVNLSGKIVVDTN